MNIGPTESHTFRGSLIKCKIVGILNVILTSSCLALKTVDVNGRFVQKDLDGLHPREDGKRLQERITAVKCEGRKYFSPPHFVSNLR